MLLETLMNRPLAVPTATAAWVGFAADVLLTIGLILLLSLAGGIGWALIQGATGNTSSLTPGVLAQMGMAVLATGGTALILYLTRRRATEAEKAASLAAMYRPRTWGLTLLTGAMVFLGSLAISWLFSRFSGNPTPSNVGLMLQAREQYPLLLVLFAVVLAPFYEELLYRRVLFGRLAVAGRVLPGLLISSLLFALSHELPGISGQGWGGMLQLWLIYGGMGAAFAWLYHRTGTLAAPVAAHALNNAAALAGLMLGMTPT